MTVPETERETPRERILTAATRLLAAQGREGVSTRSVSAAADVQPQTIYRQFGDMDGLMSAVAQRGFALYYGRKTAAGDDTDDPVAVLRQGWDTHIDFALGHPALYALMFGDADADTTDAANDVREVLEGILAAVARAGRLRVGIPEAVQVVLAANVGTALSLIGLRSSSTSEEPDVARADDPGGLSRRMREIVMSALVVDDDEADAEAGATDAGRWAVALRAELPATADRFTPGELTLLGELLDRIS